MRRMQLGVSVAVGMALLSMVLWSGCKPSEESSSDTEGPGGSGITKTKKALTPIAMGKGVIKGKVTWKGEKPDIAKLNADLLSQIEKKQDAKVCLNCGSDEKTQQIYRIGTKDGVGNVVIWVMPADRDSFFDFTPENIKDLNLPPKKVIGQPHCEFLPHVEIAFTNYADAKNPRKLMKATGQKVEVLNDAEISHNTKWSDTGNIQGGNVLLAPGKPKELDLDPEPQPLIISCSIHEWMEAYIWDFNHPYAAVSKYTPDKPDAEDYGTFEIRNVPTNVKLKIVAWHEKGVVTPIGGEEIEIDGKKPELVKDFEITKK